jgi:hypothetical protein
MGENMKESKRMIKRKDMEHFFGVMAKYIKECGKMESNMEKENIILLTAINGEKVFGKMEKELDGLMKYKMLFNKHL